MDCEGTSQAPSFRSLLPSLPLLFHPPSLHSHLSAFSVFLLVLAGNSFYSSGIIELKLNSSLARSQRGITSQDVSPCMERTSIHPYLCCPMLLPLAGSPLSRHTTTPRLVLQWFVRYFLDTGSSFVTVTVRNVKHLLGSSSH